MAVCAAAIGTSRQLCVKYGWFVPPIVWLILVGESGTQKSPPFRMAMAPLKDRQQRDADSFIAANCQYQNELKSYKREHKAWERKGEGEEPQQPERPIRRRCIVQDSTIEALAPILSETPRGVLLARDELSGWLASFDKYSNKAATSSEVPKWLEIYNCETISIDRKTGDERFIFVRRPSVSICGGIQPGILAKCLTNEHKDSGLQSRLLMTFPPRQAKQWRDDEVSPATQTAYGDAVRDLFEFQGDDSSGESKPATLKLSPEARALFKRYVNETGREQAAMSGHLATNGASWKKSQDGWQSSCIVSGKSQRALLIIGRLTVPRCNRLSTWVSGSRMRRCESAEHWLNLRHYGKPDIWHRGFSHITAGESPHGICANIVAISSTVKTLN